MQLVLPQTRRKSREVSIGNLPLGGKNPIRVQSMTNTNTMDIQATVEQVMRLVDVGCDYVRITAPGTKEAYALSEIKNELQKRGYTIPLIADIHYNPKAAEIAAEIVDKVRINPGNYVDRSKGKIHFTKEEYQTELIQIASRLENLISICKKNNTAIRIGTNHGSLSERIISTYGNTPLGMATSAMEFIHICRDFDFHQLVLSMKASNVNTMIYSTRLLIQMMQKEGLDYPIHLGVTEAGDGEDGRIKSSAGIGCLLSEGIGDTIRVSLTEAPEKEIPVAKKIVSLYNYPISEGYENQLPIKYEKRKTVKNDLIGANLPPVVLSVEKNTLSDYYFIDDKTIQNQQGDRFPFYENIELFMQSENHSAILNFVKIVNPSEIATPQTNENVVFVADFGENILADLFNLFNILESSKITIPVIIKIDDSDIENLLIKGSSVMGQLFADGWCDGIFCGKEVETAFAVLQACGRRITRAEFISCPSCGRTQYDIEATLKEVKKHTSHLKGIKIGVMGCIVNGPGEMADADYGYVGNGHGKVTLYKGKEPVIKNINQSEAVEALIELIKSSGDWKEN